MITMTEIAAKRARGFLDKRGSGLGLRILITTTGCSGHAYNIEFADRINPDDKEFFSNGVKIVIDKKSLLFMDGTEIDYVVSGLNEGFEFDNPLTKAKCGCGESFTI